MARIRSAVLNAGEIDIPLSEIEFTYARSSGPGGQNVNKVNSKAILRWSPAESGALSEDFRARLLLRLADRLTVEGDLVLSSDRFRDQGRNREDCLDKLRTLVIAACQVPKRRTKTRPTRSSQRKNREAKKRHSDKKRFRGSPSEDS